MDTNYRGGPPGFVRVISNDSKGAVLVYPEYSGNRLYQSLGNLMMNHQAGVVFPSFETGDALHMTVTTEILMGADADALLPRCNLAVKMTVVEARYVEKSLGFRGVPIDTSPYTPPIRYLRSEKEQIMSSITAKDHFRARLMSKQMLSPSIARFRFKLSNAGDNLPKYKPGQYAVFSFKDELDKGYSHMRDDDPLSLNDDYIRTFTVSSFPGHNLPDDEFEITVRKNRSVTSYMFEWYPRTELEVPMLGFGGSFKIGNDQDNKSIIPFIAGGIGITPLLGQLPGLDVSRLRLFWSISIDDAGLVQDIFQQFPQLPQSTTLFISQSKKTSDAQAVESSGATVEYRRIQQRDLKGVPADTFYLCSGRALQSSVLVWLEGRNVVYEDFNY
jgi:ferredoxin-NADP reductase